MIAPLSMTVTSIVRADVFLRMELPSGGIDRTNPPIALARGEKIVLSLGDDGRLLIERKGLLA